MKKAMTIIAVFAALLGLGSSSTSKAVDGKVGALAPMFKVERADTVVELDQLKGQWVLLHFWSAARPASRIAMKQYDMFEQRSHVNSHQEQFRLIAVNMDRTEGLFRETVGRDGLNAKSQFFIEKERAKKLMADYHLDSSLGSFLINPEGRIIAINPTDQQLNELSLN